MMNKDVYISHFADWRRLYGCMETEERLNEATVNPISGDKTTVSVTQVII